MTAAFVIEALQAKHDRLSFSCGVESLDRYLKTQATQDMRRHVANCFVATMADSRTIAGYYTLAAASIPLAELPSETINKLPKYQNLPAALVGRLAVDLRYAGRSLGSTLLFDALERAARTEIAAYALVVEATNENAAAFYRHIRFMELKGKPMSFFLPIATAQRLP